DKTLPGNVLDKELQGCQQGQTKGLPIGPDTSLAISEILLAEVDETLAAKATINGGVRFIDDIELSFKRLADAEAAVAALEALLNEFELQLNAAKTKIVKLPESLDASFATQLRPYIPPEIGASRSHWTDYFNLAFNLATKYPADGVLRYA